MDPRRPIIFDGAFGTNLVSKLTNRQVGRFLCNEELNLIVPGLVKSVHLDFLRAGAMVIETNTFGANRIALSEHGLSGKTREINYAAVKIAKDAIRTHVRFAPRTGKFFVSASIGPTGKLPTLGHISFDEMVDAYREQAAYLIEAGADMLQIETCQDVLQAKAAVIGCRSAFCGARAIPIMVTMTLEPAGTTLLGTDIGAALVSLVPLGIFAFGLNCGTGPAEMEEHIRYLSRTSPVPVAVLANAGMPEIRDGVAHYPLGPEEFGEWAEYFVNKLGVGIIGGCCGTTPDHIAEVRRRLDAGANRSKKCCSYIYAPGRCYIDSVSSLYSPVLLDQTPRPLIIGERMNISGSKEFREHILSGDFEAAAQMARRQAELGAHVVDVSVAYTGRDEMSDMREIVRRAATVSPLPLMIDSTSPEVIEEALKHLGGRCIINSINLEDGGKKAAAVIELAKRHGAVIVGLVIDPEGMARTKRKKLAVASKLVKMCKGLPLFIDPLTFTLADPKAAGFGSGLETLKALKEIKRRHKGVRTLLGVSNISYGFRPDARKVLNSIFLREALKKGLDAAIIHPGQILPAHKIGKAVTKLALDLIYCRRKDALQRFVAAFEGKQVAVKSPIVKDQRSRSSDEKLLKIKIKDGDKKGLSEVIGRLIKNRPATKILNDILLPAMKEVGELFGRGELVLPFVLASAEVMREAVELLAPYMGEGRGKARGKLVIATVKGDVHDIGKDLVDIILSNNGYKVVNLGVKQPVEEIIKAIELERPDAVGLSGLLVQSCMVMKEDVAELARRGIAVPVICGGAALNRKFVENDIARAYKGRVYYARDAFEGLRIMGEICG